MIKDFAISMLTGKFSKIVSFSKFLALSANLRCEFFKDPRNSAGSTSCSEEVVRQMGFSCRLWFLGNQFCRLMRYCRCLTTFAWGCPRTSAFFFLRKGLQFSNTALGNSNLSCIDHPGSKMTNFVPWYWLATILMKIAYY